MPQTAILYIAERCNQKCVFCLEEDGSWREFVDPSTQQVYAELERLFAHGARHITFMGGETFFRKDLPRILERAKSVGFTRLGVTTNGTVLAKPGFVPQLVRAGLDFIELSVHGHTQELATRISRAKLTHERQASAMSEINSTGSLPTIVNVVVCRENKDHLREVSDYVLVQLDRVPVRFKFKFVSLQGWAAGNDQALGYDEVDFVALAEHLSGKNVAFWFHNVPLCRLGAHAQRSHELSTLAADETYFDFDHRDHSGYYQSGAQLEGRVWPEETCAACSHRPICPGLEETHRLACGAGALSPRSDDPLPLIEYALRDRGLDERLAGARLTQLNDQPRPSRFRRSRPDGAIRLDHADEQEPLDLMVELFKDESRFFSRAGRFTLGYRNWSTGEPTSQPRVAALLQAISAELTVADRTGATLDEARARLVQVAERAGWRLDSRSQVPAQHRKHEGLRVINDAPKPPDVSSR